MRAAVARPGDPYLRVVDMPEDAEERNQWLHEQVGELLDFNTLGAWRDGDNRVQMVNNDFFDGLEVNEVGTRLYDPQQRTGWRICGPIVVFGYNDRGESIPLPQPIVDRWILNGFTVVEGKE